MGKMHQRSVGSMISTVCFLGLSLVFFMHAAELMEAGLTLKAFGLGACALACLAGGLRFVIHDAVERLKEHW